MSLIQSKTFTTKNIRKFIFIIFFTFLILGYKNFTYGAIITVDISQQPILLNALKISTWDKNETRVFLAEGNARIEQGGVQITANSMS